MYDKVTRKKQVIFLSPHASNVFVFIEKRHGQMVHKQRICIERNKRKEAETEQRNSEYIKYTQLQKIQCDGYTDKVFYINFCADMYF